MQHVYVGVYSIKWSLSPCTYQTYTPPTLLCSVCAVDSEDELKKEKAKKRSSTMGFFRKTLRRKDDGSDKDRPLSTSSLSFDSRDSDGVDDTQIIEDEAVSTKSSNRNSISSVFFGSNSQSSTSLASAGAASGVVPREKKGDRNSMNRTSTASSDSQ
eukprot:comp19433_c0_seq2/m.22551 comp19433_c0_seq2/g.22551  ORF comp19433_c0_seq2/g.22551 comp19433_c0_seq2/m.22551 type:complete len:157 (-) comp19433_c0_seq2:531-1001(-)